MIVGFIIFNFYLTWNNDLDVTGFFFSGILIISW